MKKVIFLLLSTLLLSACNDGDIIVTTFDFSDASLEVCGFSGTYVFYKINSDTNESISLSVNTNDDIFTEQDDYVFLLNSSSNIVNYRKYNGTVTADYFCSIIPPTSPIVTSEYIATSGEATLSTVITLDDEDGIEELDLTLDTDGDLIPDYYDFDDDGDNVPTIVELGEDYLNGIADEPLDTDGDGTPDYLDTNDDNDEVLTINEDADGNLDPANDRTDGVPNYLNGLIEDENVITEYREHSYNFNSTITLILTNIVLINGSDEITQETMSLGTNDGIVDDPVTITPTF